MLAKSSLQLCLSLCVISNRMPLHLPILLPLPRARVVTAPISTGALRTPPGFIFSTFGFNMANNKLFLVPITVQAFYHLSTSMLVTRLLVRENSRSNVMPKPSAMSFCIQHFSLFSTAFWRCVVLCLVIAILTLHKFQIDQVNQFTPTDQAWTPNPHAIIPLAPIPVTTVGQLHSSSISSHWFYGSFQVSCPTCSFAFITHSTTSTSTGFISCISAFFTHPTACNWCRQASTCREG